MPHKMAKWPTQVKANWPIDWNIGHVILNHMEKPNIREQVVEFLERTGMSVAELHRRSGVSYDVINKLKRRPNASTSAENAEKLLAIIGSAAGSPTADTIQKIEEIKSLLTDLDGAQIDEVKKFAQFLVSRSDESTLEN